MYIGETSRSLFERSTEHLDDLLRLNEKSVMLKHWVNFHGDLDQCPRFRFKVVRKFRDALSRIVDEAVRIEGSEIILMNSKREIGRKWALEQEQEEQEENIW